MHLYCVATNTGKDFFTHEDTKNFYLRGFPGNVWVVGNNLHGQAWITRVKGTLKTLEEAQAIVDAVIQTGQTSWDALGDAEKAPAVPSNTRPLAITLPNEE